MHARYQHRFGYESAVGIVVFLRCTSRRMLYQPWDLDLHLIGFSVCYHDDFQFVEHYLRDLPR